jgi:hypothetical protein
MSNENVINNSILLEIIENSNFTERQIQIIYKIYNNEKRLKEISSGAYYREVKQCRNKIKKFYYSIILLRLLNILNEEKLFVLNSIVDKLYTLENNHDKYHNNNLKSVIDIIEQVLDRILL